MKIVVVGTGYVGLVAGACFAQRGEQVICLDTNEEIVTKLNRGQPTILEPGLEDILKQNVPHGTLSFTADKDCLDSADIIVIAVGTPQSNDGDANLSYLNGVVDDIRQFTNEGKIVVIKSTVPVGTAQMVRNKLNENSADKIYHVVSNPEFLREGSAVHDFLYPDRIIIGLSNQNLKEKMVELYKEIVSDVNKIVFTDNASAELIKYASNSYLAMRLAFLNEISDISEKVGADIDDVALGMGLDTRIGSHYLKVGPGFGGSCFPKDTKAFEFLANKAGVPSKILHAVIEANNARKQRLAVKCLDLIKDIANPVVTILGVTFKADTDDIRDSASLEIIDYLLQNNVQVKAYDPSNTEQFENKYKGRLKLEGSIDSAIHESDLIVICTEWKQFKDFDFNAAHSQINTRRILDLRNIIDRNSDKVSKFLCYSLGKANA